MDKVIIGANGQLGKALKAKYPDAKAVDYKELDITNLDSLNNFSWENIKIILNAAGFTNVDGAETEDGRSAAWKVNATGVANLARIANQKNLTLIHISTDYVFDGAKNPHTENEDFSPLSSYGASKAAGDIAAALVDKHYIIRTSWVIGEGKNFVQTMLELGKKGVEPKVVADQIGRPTFTRQLVAAIDYLLRKSPEFGTYNVTNDGQPISWSDLTREIFNEAGYKLKVEDTTTVDYTSSKEKVAPRPLNSILDLSKIKTTGLVLSDWHEDLREYIKKEQTE